MTVSAETAIDKETIYTCYVTDEKNKLIGLVSAKDLMLADKNAFVADIMENNVIYAHTLDDKEEVARKISTYGLLAIPITDREMRLVGIVTVDDANRRFAGRNFRRHCKNGCYYARR